MPSTHPSVLNGSALGPAAGRQEGYAGNMLHEGTAKGTKCLMPHHHFTKRLGSLHVGQNAVSVRRQTITRPHVPKDCIKVSSSRWQSVVGQSILKREQGQKGDLWTRCFFSTQFFQDMANDGRSNLKDRWNNNTTKRYSKR